MNIITIVIIVGSILFGLYKVVLKIQRYHIKKIDIRSLNIIDKQIDNQKYSSLSFDFPDVQSEIDMKIINSGPDLCKQRDELNVTQYCKY